MKKTKRKAKTHSALKRSISQIFGSTHLTYWHALYILLFFISLQWLPEILSYIFRLFGEIEIAGIKLKVELLIKTIIILLSFSIIFIFYRKYIMHREIIVEQEENPKPVKVLLLFLSPIGPANIRHARQEKIESLTENRNSHLIDELKKEIEHSWSWAMPIKAIEHHKNRLEKLYIVPSHETYQDFEYFKKLLKLIFPENSFEIHLFPRHKKGIDFFNIEEVFNTVKEFINEIKKMKIKDNDILIDITGGTVPVSVGSAIAVSIMGKNAQYVLTTTKKVITYNITYLEDE